MILGVLFPVFLFLSFAIGRDLPLGFMVAGLLGMMLFFTATAVSPIVVPWEAQARTLERLLCCPIKIETIVLGDIIASFSFGVCTSAVPILLGLLGGLKVSRPLLLGAAILLAASCFASLGSVFSTPATNLPATVNMIAAVVKFPIVFISGIFLPLDVLPSWARKVAYLSPLTYFTDIARSCLEGRSALPVSLDLFALLGFGALFFTVAVRLHRRTMPKRV